MKNENRVFQFSESSIIYLFKKKKISDNQFFFELHTRQKKLKMNCFEFLQIKKKYDFSDWEKKSLKLK